LLALVDRTGAGKDANQLSSLVEESMGFWIGSEIALQGEPQPESRFTRFFESDAVLDRELAPRVRRFGFL